MSASSSRKIVSHPRHGHDAHNIISILLRRGTFSHIKFGAQNIFPNKNVTFLRFPENYVVYCVKITKKKKKVFN